MYTIFAEVSSEIKTKMYFWVQTYKHNLCVIFIKHEVHLLVQIASRKIRGEKIRGEQESLN